MIKSLTKEQEKQLVIYRDEYIKKGLNTKRIDKDKCIKDMHNIYKYLLKRKPVPIVVLNSPFECWIAANIFIQVRDQIRHQVSDQVRKQVWDQVRHQVSDQVEDQVGDQVGHQVRTYKIIDYVSPYLQGSFDSYIFAFYDYFKKSLNIKYNKLQRKYDVWKKSMEYGMIFPLNNICFVSEKPIEININNKVLHADYKPALLYAGGFALWRLNGIPVPEWVIMTKPENMDAKKILEIKNVETRREAIRKMGYSLFFEQLQAEILDTKKIWVDENQKVYKKESGTKIDYQLLACDVGLERKVKVLKMKNPSLEGIYHYETVPFECKTIEDAIEFRNGERCLPLYLS